MTQLGADPEDLRGLARSLRAAAGQLDALSLGLARRTRAAAWRGPDAEAFERQWQARHRPALGSISSGFGDMARRLDHHAAEQSGASSADLSAVATPAAGATHRASAGPSSLAPPSVAPPLPLLPAVEDRYVGNLELRVGPLTTGIVGELTVQQLEGSRRRVVLAEQVAGGGMLSVGSSAELGIGGPHGTAAPTGGATGEARLRAGAVLRRSWELDEDRIDDLLTRLAIEHGSSAVTGQSDGMVRAAAALDELAERLTGHDPGLDLAASIGSTVPTPTAREQLVEVELAAGAGMGLGAIAGLGGRGQGALGVRIGEVRRGADRAQVVELQGSATAALTSTVLRRLGIALPPEAHRGVSVRLELPQGDGAAAPTWATVRVGASSDSTVHDVVAVVDLGGPDAAASARALSEAVAALGRGDLAGAVLQLDGVHLDPEHVTATAATGTLTGTTARAGAAVGLGIGAGGAVRGQVLHLERG